MSAGAGNDAQILFQFLGGHSDTVVRDGQGARVVVHSQPDAEILTGQPDLVVRQREKAQLVNGVRRVGDQLAEEYLPVSVDRVYHHVQKTPGLRLELFFRHFCFLPPYNLTAYAIMILQIYIIHPGGMFFNSNSPRNEAPCFRPDASARFAQHAGILPEKGRLFKGSGRRRKPHILR